MAEIEKSKFRIGLFKWHVKLSPEEACRVPSESLGGVFLFRLNTDFPTSTKTDHNYIREVKAIPFHQLLLGCFKRLPTTEALVKSALKLLSSFCSCNNFESLAHEIAKDLRCRFYFGPEILSGRGPKPLIFVELDVTMKRDEYIYPSRVNTMHSISDSVDDDNNVAENHDANYTHDELSKLIHGAEQIIGDVLKRHTGLEVEESKGFVEVKPSLEVKNFDHDDKNCGVDSESKVCPICLERLSEGPSVALKTCSHTFHKDCVCQWLLISSNISCPLCRSSCAICF